MRDALALHAMYQQVIRQPKGWGMQTYVFHGSKTYYFKRPEEIKSLANRIAKNILQKRTK